MKPVVRVIEELILENTSPTQIRKITLSGRDLDICQRNAEIRQRQIGQSTMSSFAYHLQGVIGEAAVLRAFGAPLRFLHKDEDFGVDLVIGTIAVDVKCTSGPMPKCNLLLDADKEVRADVLMLARTDEPFGLREENDSLEVDLLGWIERETFMRDAKTFKTRQGLKRRLMNTELRPIEEFATQLEQLIDIDA